MSQDETPKEAYDRGMPLRVIKRRFHMSDSELQDRFPDEFEDETTGSENPIGGY